MSNSNKSGETPANQQKGKKQCSCCHEEKKLTDFYLSYSPLYSIDKRVPICKECCKNLSLNEDGSFSEVKLKDTLRKIDKPLYYDLIHSAQQSVKKENSYISEEEIRLHGLEIIQKYFTLIAMRQDRAKSYTDSENEGFIHQNSNRSLSEKSEIKNAILNEMDMAEEPENVVWSSKDEQNKNYVISTVGYDPFDDIGLKESDRKYCFNILSGYCDTDGITDDGNKMQGVIEMTLMYCQCKKITESMNEELSKKDPNDQKISRLTQSKSSLLGSISTIARDNNISSNYNKNSKQGQNSLTSKMKEMAENNFELIKVNLFDIKTSEAFKQIADLSNQSIMEQLTFDNNDYVEVVKEQRELIQKQESDIDILNEENRNLKNKIIDLENRKR